MAPRGWQLVNSVNMKIGIIEDGKLKGKRILVIGQDNKLPRNLHWVEKGEFLNGTPKFALHCLVCDVEVPGACPECNSLE